MNIFEFFLEKVPLSVFTRYRVTGPLSSEDQKLSSFSTWYDLYRVSPSVQVLCPMSVFVNTTIMI